MKALFSSTLLQKKFERQGYVKVPLLSAEEVAVLVEVYETVAEEHEKINIAYITTSHSNNAALIAKVDASLQKVIAPAVSKYLVNYKLLFGNFLIKMPGSGSETSPHQDITFVDESQYASVNIWVALQDMDNVNGCMYFLPGSHNFTPTLRPTHNYPWAYENVVSEIKKQSKPFPVKAGDAFIFNHAVIHGSYSNNSTQPRIAAVMAAYHSDAELFHYYLPEGVQNKVQKYSMTKEAFLHFIKGGPPPKGVFLHEITYHFKQYNTEEFIEMSKAGIERLPPFRWISTILKKERDNYYD